MHIDFVSVAHCQRLGDSATHPIAPLAARQGALLLLAGRSLPRRRAYPDTLPAAHSGVFNRGIQDHFLPIIKKSLGLTENRPSQMNRQQQNASRSVSAQPHGVVNSPPLFRELST